MKLVLAPELFVVPYEGSFLLYAPFANSVVRVNASVVEQLKLLPFTGKIVPTRVEALLLSRKILVDLDAAEQQSPPRIHRARDVYQPTSVTLFTTFDCNLRCIYCYSEGGSHRDVMPENIVEAAVRTIVDNAISSGSKRIHVGFHGGGEPFFGAGWERMRTAVDFAKAAAKKHGLKLGTSSATNCLLNEGQLEWLKENLDHVNLSIDGPPEIQDKQRPGLNDSASSPFVERTVAFLEKHGVRYGIRTTITRESVERMPEIVRYFRSISSIQSFHLEGLFECGRCATSKVRAPEHPHFAERFIELLGSEEAKGVEIYYSGGRFSTATSIFCGALGDNFTVTPLGQVTTCHEVSHPSDPRADSFLIGNFDENTGKFVIDENKRGKLHGRTVDSLPHCADCFAKFGCAGDCPAKSALAGNMFDPSLNSRCPSNRMITIHRMAAAVREDGAAILG